jgi:hypothetical protein
VVEGTGNTVTAAGNAVSQIGQQIKDTNVPLVPTGAKNATGDVVINAGATVATLGAGVANGLGKMGAVDNPVGVTVANTGNVVTQTGKTVVSAGDLVQAVGTGQRPTRASYHACRRRGAERGQRRDGRRQSARHGLVDRRRGGTDG